MESKLEVSDKQVLPKIVHFIWVGGPIPADDLRFIHQISAIAKKSGFEVNLWVDNEMNYHKTAKLEDITIPNLKLRNVSELDEKIAQDPFFAEDSRQKKLAKSISREEVGFKNLAAAADLYRYVILRYFGGYYIDTDTRLKSNEKAEHERLSGKEKLSNTAKFGVSELEMIPDQAEFGIKVNGNFKIFKARVKSESEEPTIRSVSMGGNNDVIGVMPMHEVIDNALLAALQEYEKLDSTKIEKEPYPALYNPQISRKETTSMDAKRFPFGEQAEGKLNRRTLTIQTSGPSILFSSLQKFWEKLKDKRVKTVEGLSFNKKDVANLPIEFKSELRWLQKKSGPAYTTDSLPNKFFSSKTKDKDESSMQNTTDRNTPKA
ncbi:glycosyltransferase [Legionella beliardensis]|uniref:Glycosyltransferase n=1 Tax=Legionella beliardensis TaxID=91822 RepID=A0A378HYU6_9GAMM|nr:TcdA/TcdB catalytic glycosyltransferase domain-containing protein [Legionella beliardensis]STX27932.1 glycosyltransferase [Legionella beliardensis]